MKNALIATMVVAFGLTVLSPTMAMAAGPGWRGWGKATPHHQHHPRHAVKSYHGAPHAGHYHEAYRPAYDARYPNWNTPQRYPQFYGGFHYRNIFLYGYPTGDIGLRGTAW